MPIATVVLRTDKPRRCMQCASDLDDALLTAWESGTASCVARIVARSKHRPAKPRVVPGVSSTMIPSPVGRVAGDWQLGARRLRRQPLLGGLIAGLSMRVGWRGDRNRNRSTVAARIRVRTGRAQRTTSRSRDHFAGCVQAKFHERQGSTARGAGRCCPRRATCSLALIPVGRARGTADGAEAVQG